MPTPRKPPPATPKPLVVESARAAALFAHPRRRRILFAFAGDDRSLAEVVKLADVPMNLLHYHVQRMVAAGLIQRREKPLRAGRRVQLYRAAATAFVVPAALMPGRPDDELRRELARALERDNADAYLFAREPDGRVRMRKLGTPGTGELWRVARLDDASARELTTRISRLIDSFEKRASGRAKPHLIHVALARRS